MEAAYQCPACVARGKPWEGTDPKCAFAADGSFVVDNWACATLLAIRDMADREEHAARRWRIDDLSLAVLPVLNGHGGYVVLSYYKNRGATPVARFMRDDEDQPLTLRDAQGAMQR